MSGLYESLRRKPDWQLTAAYKYQNKEFKIVEGLDFLPRKTDKLVDTLQEWLEEFVEKGSSALKNKIGAVINELLRRKEISKERYDQIKDEHNIL